jgi:hypothetical protein
VDHELPLEKTTLLQQFRSALENETRARDEAHSHPGDWQRMDAWLRAMDATHEASRRLREGTR